MLRDFIISGCRMWSTRRQDFLLDTVEALEGRWAIRSSSVI